MAPLEQSCRHRVVVYVHADELAEFLRLSTLLQARDFYAGAGRSACRRFIVRAIRRELRIVKRDLARMGKDWRVVLENAKTPLADDHVPQDYGRADPIIHDE